ncbi:DoxX family protein [Paenibacillus sp. GSMTC-2017]|uniref:DoxX family protein n=1 Tax=Paenibacillus sp. GSMTC-2017 TaxID=2794350 RepID=UPI0018D7F713|nr:DoxX family protein [Paenibacillus sp. GSMTC-2017]MBH5319503.1 DoxX family protein [Paenibacillus sp. GSMTC-2017]
MTKVSVVTTIMRVVLGVLFLAHGISKLQMGLGNVEGWFSSIGVPGVLAYVVAVLELVGGIMLIIGFLTRYVSAAFVVMLIGAVFTAKLSAGLLGSNGSAGYEMDLTFMLIALYLIVADRSPVSLDHILFKKRSA